MKPHHWSGKEPARARKARRQIESSRAEQRDATTSTIAAAFSRLPGGKDEGIYYAKLAASNLDNPFAGQLTQVVETYWAMNDFDRRLTTIDDICIKVGMRPSRFFAEVLAEMRDYRLNVSELVALEAHAGAVESLARMAVKDTDIDGKKMLFQHSNWLPQPKNSVVNYYNSVGAQTAIVSAEKSGLPAFEDGVIATSNFLRAATTPALEAHVQPEDHPAEPE